MLNIGETGWTLHRSTNEGAQSPDEWMSALQHVKEKTKKICKNSDCRNSII